MKFILAFLVAALYVSAAQTQEGPTISRQAENTGNYAELLEGGPAQESGRAQVQCAPTPDISTASMVPFDNMPEGYTVVVVRTPVSAFNPNPHLNGMQPVYTIEVVGLSFDNAVRDVNGWIRSLRDCQYVAGENVLRTTWMSLGTRYDDDSNFVVTPIVIPSSLVGEATIRTWFGNTGERYIGSWDTGNGIPVVRMSLSE